MTKAMISFQVQCADGLTRDVVAYNINDFPYENQVTKKICTHKDVSYYNLIATFDIETTTTTYNSKIIGFMYHWQFCLNKLVVFGRTWQEYFEFLNRLKDALGIELEKRLVVWVHNLSFEFQFLRMFREWDSYFAKDRREVLKAVDADGFEYRCSYYLTNKSLAKACETAKNCIFRKLDGDEYDYKKIRTPKTKMLEYELGYCYCDVRGLYDVIADYMEEDTLASIPMTSTGFVRRRCRNAMRQNPENYKLFKRTALSNEQYLLLQDVKRGGNTHGNRAFVGMILKDVHCVDISSSYPYAMMVQYYPMSSFMRVNRIHSRKSFERYCEKYCCMFRITFQNLQIKNGVPVPYIPYAKLTKHGKKDIVFNGRVLASDACQMAMTEIDWQIIKQQYTWDRIAVSDMYIAERGELPKELKDAIREYYEKKTALKGVDDYLYGKSKNELNGIFGMTCTDPVHDIIEINENGEWVKTKGDLSSELNTFYRSRNSFLPIQWGVWVTAHARAWLQKAIDITGMNTLYVDTDSDKFQNVDEHAFDELNQTAIALAKKYGAYAHDRKGNIHYMGVFDIEQKYERFKTWGAKKYAYELLEKDGTIGLHITVAGVHKKKGAEWLKQKGGLEAFEPMFCWNEGHGGGTESHWNDDGVQIIRVNGEQILTAANVGMLDSTYTLGITEEFAQNKEFFIDNA